YGGLDNNGIGLVLAMGVPMCLFVWEGTRRWWRWGFLIAIPVVVHSVLMSFSRGAMLSLVAATPLFVLRSRHRAILLPAMLGLFILLLPVMAGKEIRERFFSINQYEKDGSVRARFASWKAAWDMAKDHPIFGVGLRNADLLSFDYGADFQGRTIHSHYLQM